MLNKFLIPAALVATVVIAGIFAFMPVEKASTVHGTLATTTSQTTNTNTITANTNAQDRGFSFSLNMSRTADSGVHALIPAAASGSTAKALTGSFVISATANNATAVTHAPTEIFECGIITIGTNGVLAGNATDDWTTGSASGNGTFTNAKGLAVQYDYTTSTVGGLCTGTIFLNTATE